mgnify:CR=1 FL=1
MGEAEGGCQVKLFEKMEQGSEQWYAVRKGRATASEMSKILTSTGRLSTQALGYMRKLARECVCDDPLEFMGNKYTDWGKGMEEEARAHFVRVMRMDVVEVGFCARADGAPLGCSPDGLIVGATGGWVGGLEIKCPQVDTHVGYLMDGRLPSNYKLQVHGSMAVTGLPYWYFMSYFPGLNPLIVRVDADDFTQTVTAALDQFVVDYAEERERVLKAIVPVTGGDTTEAVESEEAII